MIEVHLPSQLDEYTQGQRCIAVDLSSIAKCETLTVMHVVNALDQQYRGMAFRIVDEQQKIRRHIAFFVGDEMVRELSTPIHNDARIQIVGALSGG
jgi:sulfur-carrier protein